MFKGSIPAVITPFVEDKVDYDSLTKVLNHLMDNGSHGLVPCGTTGESPTLSHDEHKKIIEETIRIADKRIPVIAGTGANSTSEAIELTKSAKNNGADGCLLVTPYYNKPTQEGLYQHYKKIADLVDIPQILYNVPGRTSVDMQPETVLRLSTHKNIVGIKEASGNKDRSKSLMKLCSQNMRIFTGDDKTSLSDIADGFSGNISVTANIAPLKMHQMCKSALEGDIESASKLNSNLDILHDLLFCESNPIPVKWCLHKMGLIKKGIRLPLTWMDEKFDRPLTEGLIKSGIVNE